MNGRTKLSRTAVFPLNIPVGDREFLSTHTHILYNDKGTFGGIPKVIASQELNEAGDAFTGRYRIEVPDVNGRVVTRIAGTIAGKPVVPEPL